MGSFWFPRVVSFACGSLVFPRVLAVATVSGGEGRGSGRRERGLANVYRSLSLLPVPVRAFCPVVNVSTGSLMGKCPRAVSARGRRWACIYICLKSKPFDCPSLSGLFLTLIFVRVVVGAGGCGCGRGCGCAIMGVWPRIG